MSFIDDDLKQWLFLEGDFLVGIPNRSEKERIKITAKKEPVISCDITIKESFDKLPTKFPRKNTMNPSSLKCASFEQVTIFSVRLARIMPGKSRLRMFRKICELLQDKIHSCRSIVIESGESFKSSSVLQSGRIKNNDDSDVTIVWWPVSCSSEPLDSASLRHVKKLVESGEFSRVLDARVFGWEVVDRGDDKARFAAGSLQKTSSQLV